MLVLFYIIISIELITVFYNLIKFLIYKLNRKSNLKKLSSHNENFHINVLIPCYTPPQIAAGRFCSTC